MFNNKFYFYFLSQTTLLFNKPIFLNDHFQSTCLKDLKFESTLSKEERHQIANNIGLKTLSIGTGQNRYLTIGKKRSPHDILEPVVANSGQNGKYKLLKKD